MDDSIASLKIGIMEDLLKIFNVIMEDDDTPNSQNEDTKTENECLSGVLTTLLSGIVDKVCDKMTSESGYVDNGQLLISNDALGSTKQETMLAVDSTVLAAVTAIPKENNTYEEKRGENVLITLGGIVEIMCDKMTSESGYADNGQLLISNDALGSTKQETMLAVHAIELVPETDIQKKNKTSEEKCGENVLTTILLEVDEPICDEISYELGCKDDSELLISYDAPGSPGQDTILAADATEQAEKVDGDGVLVEGQDKKREEKELAEKNDPETPPATNHKLSRRRSRRFITTTWKGVRRATRLLLCGCFRGE